MFPFVFQHACSRAFHTTCAFYAGLKMEIKESQSKKSGDLIINRFAYCHEHSRTGYLISLQRGWREKKARAVSMS